MTNPVLNHEFYPASQSLKKFIAGYHILEGNSLTENQKISSLSKMYILINYGDRLMSVRKDGRVCHIDGVQFYGLSLKPGEFGKGVENLKMVAVELQNEIVSSMLRENMSDLVDQIIDAGNFIDCSSFHFLPESLSAAINSDEKVSLLDSAFYDFFASMSFKDDHLLQSILESILSKRGNISYAELSAKTGCSERSLRRKMLSAVGVPAIRYGNIVRSEYVLANLFVKGKKTFHDIVHEFNYFDQAHLIHDVRKSIQMRPGQILPSPELLSQYKVLHDRYF